MFGGMSEYERGPALDQTAFLEDGQIIVEGDAAERDNGFYVGQQIELLFEVPAAGDNLLGRRLVAGGRASGGGGDVDVGQRQAVIARAAVRLGCKAFVIERAV